MVVGSFNRSEVSTVSRDRLWRALIFESHILIPKLLPELISSIEVVGDGSVGTTKKFIYAEGIKELRFTTYKMEKIDKEKYEASFSVIDGGLPVPRLKSLLTEIKFDVRSNDVETLVKFIMEYETLDDIPLSIGEEDNIINGLILMLKVVNGYLVANPTS